MSNINFSRKQHFWQRATTIKFAPLKTLPSSPRPVHPAVPPSRHASFGVAGALREGWERVLQVEGRRTKSIYRSSRVNRKAICIEGRESGERKNFYVKISKCVGPVLQNGFLCIELLQGLLVLGALLLLVTAFHVLSVHWQHQAIKRFEALDLIATELSLGKSDRVVTTNEPTIQVILRTKEISELSSLLGKSVVVEQKIVTALWQDERKGQHTIRIIS